MSVAAAYLGSIFATLYAALFMHSYILSLVCSGLQVLLVCSLRELWSSAHPCVTSQVVALLYYILSYFPGGAQGVKFMLNLFYNAVLSCFSAVIKR